jgi:hypothetical protein
VASRQGAEPKGRPRHPIPLAGRIRFRRPSFVFIDILGLFRQFWSSAAKLGLSPKGAALA